MATYKSGDGAVVGRHTVTYDTDTGGIPPGCKMKNLGTLEVEVKEGKNEFTIDLGTGEVTRQ